MKELTRRQFALLCFTVLMENGDGIIEKAPQYVFEKSILLDVGYSAFAHLDFYNMSKVVNWHQFWSVDLPEEVAKEYKMQQEAVAELKAKGFDL